jgi:hypothetical protein
MDTYTATMSARARAREIKRKVLNWRDYLPAHGRRDGKTRPANQDARLRDQPPFPFDTETGARRSERT